MDPARALTVFYHVNVARSIADNIGKMDAMLMLGGHRFGLAFAASYR